MKDVLTLGEKIIKLQQLTSIDIFTHPINKTVAKPLSHFRGLSND
jgi:hypothetical protein